MKKIISIILTVVMILSALASSAISAGAVTYIIDGDWLLAIESDTTYLVGGYNGTDTEITMPETANGKDVIGVAEDFSDNCESPITSVTMPDSYTTIEPFAFYNCSALEQINFPSELKVLGAMAFSNCSSIETADLSNVTKINAIPYACFSGCAQLSSALLPNSLTSLGDYAFSSCAALEQIDIPSKVTSVGANAFYECVLLSSVVLPNGLETIGENAFYNDAALTSIYVPISVSSIGANAFYPMGISGSTLTIDCYAGTYAAQYAYDNYLNFTADELVKGDVNNDGKVNIRDVTYIQLYRVGRYDISTDAKTIDRCDVTGDYQVTLRDATQIQLFKVGRISSL